MIWILKFVLYNISNGRLNQYGLMVVRYWQEKPIVLGKNPIYVTVFPPQISRGPSRDRARVAAVRGRRLTARTIAGSISDLRVLRASKYWLQDTQWLASILKIYIVEQFKKSLATESLIKLLRY
jgi:hypothetical protein